MIVDLTFAGGEMESIGVPHPGRLGLRSCAALLILCCPGPGAIASPPESWALHGQLTNVSQKHATITSPYQGPNSLAPRGRTEETTDLTLYAGARLRSNTEFWINAEVDQGFGLSNTTGMAGFPSGEAYKVGANTPYLRMPRVFVRHIFALGGSTADVAGAPNQLAGTKAQDNLTLTIGKFAVTDIFDTNSYAHDPRADFLNWSVIDAGAFDYAADPWGYTHGLAAEWRQSDRTVRAGVFQLSPEPNTKITHVRFNEFMLVSEIEQRYQWNKHPGKIKLLAFANRARMARYDDAVRLSEANGTTPDVSLVRRRQWRTGASLNLEQELTPELGLFARASINDGNKEAYEFTEINRSLAAGIVIKGRQWGRPADTFGVAGVVNALSGQARAYFSRGGIGILIGDGGLSYGAEKIVEAYYSFQLNRQLSLSFDVQHANNPAYNRDRGPVQIYGARLHAEF
jgi:high affinity Mn2+ porin